MTLEAGTEHEAGPTELLRAGLLCNDSSLYFEDGVWHMSGDPTEAALLVAGSRQVWTGRASNTPCRVWTPYPSNPSISSWPPCTAMASPV